MNEISFTIRNDQYEKMIVANGDLVLPNPLDSFFTSASYLVSVAGAASTLEAATSTVTVDWEAAWGGELAGPDGEGGGNGKGVPGENAALLNWLFCVFIWPIRVLKACCIAYFCDNAYTKQTKIWKQCNFFHCHIAYYSYNMNKYINTISWQQNLHHKRDKIKTPVSSKHKH